MAELAARQTRENERPAGENPGDFLRQGTSRRREAYPDWCERRVREYPSMNRRTLVVAILDFRSSYIEKRREPAERAAPDTEQWWIGPDLTWKIRTFGIDRDLHLYRVRGGDAEYFMEHTRRDFNGLIRAMVLLDFEDYTDEAARDRVLASAGLRPGLEVADEHGFAFWNPDGGVYKTKSWPES